MVQVKRITEPNRDTTPGQEHVKYLEAEPYEDGHVQDPQLWKSGEGEEEPYSDGNASWPIKRIWMQNG